MDVQGFAEFRIAIRPSPETNDHEVCLLADGESLVGQFSSGLMGLDPTQLLVEPCLLRADKLPHLAVIGRCSCGEVGCGSLEVQIRRESDVVVWSAADTSRSARFHADQYDAEIERALQDRTWETPERMAARLISEAVDRAALAKKGFEFEWASGRCKGGTMTVSFELTPGPYQILVELPWNGQDVQSIVDEFKVILGNPPESWPSVRWHPKTRGLGPPPISGSGWN